MNETPRIGRDLAPLLISASMQRVINIVAERQKIVDTLLSELVRRALTALQEHRLLCFDALVGDTACQLRVVKIISIHAEMVKSEAAKIHLQNLLQGVESEKLTEDDKFAILAYMLTLTRDHHIPRKTNARNLGELVNIECLLDIIIDKTPLIDKIVFNAKTELAKMSVNVLIQEAQALSIPDLQKNALVNIAKKSSVIGGAGVTTTPCYFNLQILMENIRTRGIPIVLAIHRIATNSLLKVALQSTDQRTFQRIHDPVSIAQREIILIEGLTTNDNQIDEYLRTLLGQEDAIKRYPHSRLLEVIFTIAAKHPQYVKKDKETGEHREIPIPIFAMKVSGFCKPKLPWEETISMTVKDVFDEVYSLSKSEKTEDYIKLLQLIGRDNSKKLMKGLKAIVKSDPLTMCSLYLHQKRFRDEAIEAGLCAENPRVFSIKHIKSDILGNHIAELDKEINLSVKPDEVCDDEE